MQKQYQPTILAIDSCSLPGSVSLYKGGNVVFERALENGMSHSLTLLDTVDEGLRVVGANICDIEIFAVSCGPGSFTGLRIGLATAKAFGATCNKPCVGVPTLHAVAISAGPSARTLAMLPAGRGEIFAQLLNVEADGKVIELTEAVHLPPVSVIEQFATFGSLCFTGKGADANFDLIRQMGEAKGKEIVPFAFQGGESDTEDEVWSFFQGPYVLSTSVARLALSMWIEGKQVEAEDLLPQYVRPSDPELKLLCH